MPPRRKRYLDNTAPADNTANVVRPVNRMIQVKQQDTPARREKETREYKARQERAKYTPANPRQASIGPYREKTALDKQGGRLYAEAEQRRKDVEDREAAGVVLNSLFKPILPSTYVDMAAAIKNGQVNNVTDALAAPYLTDSWSQRNPGKALATDIIAPVAIGKAGIIGRNIANRNLFTYAYLEPYGYDNPFTRGKRIVSHILSDNKLPNINPASLHDPRYRAMRTITGGYRDEAFRKYLGLPEQTPLYVSNGDGTFSYNLKYLSKGAKHVAVPEAGVDGIAGDLFTGNGGNISIKFDDANKIAHIEDVWDINPFSRMSKIDVDQPIRNTIDKVYKGLYPALYKVGTKRGRIGYKYLGGKQLNRLRYPIINDPISRGSRIINKTLNKLVSPIRNFDASTILGGKNFTLRQDIPYTQMPYEDFMDMPIDAINLGEFAQQLSNGKIVDFSRINSRGVIIK